MNNLQKELLNSLKPQLCLDKQGFTDFTQRVKQGKLIREENPSNHFCIFFLPFNAKTKEVFLGHHKKANKWLSPGGHIEKDETSFDALKREIKEELGFETNDKLKPILFATTTIDNPNISCKFHYDIWYVLLTDGKEFAISTQEFYDTQWITLAEAKKRTKDQSHLVPLDKLQTM